MKVTKRDVKPKEDEIPTNTLYDISKGNLCLLCGKCFIKLRFLYRHLEQHGIKNLCRECGKVYLNEVSYEEHVLTHNKPNTWSCSHCGKVFKRKDQLEIHTRSHNGVKPYGCNLCTKRFSQVCLLTQHQLLHKNEHPFSCAQCSKSFRSKGNLQIHIRIHSGIKPYTCVECRKSFSDPSAFNRHKIIHSGLKPYKCKKCPSAFADNGSLSRHKLLHGAEYPFSCDHCNKAFRTKAYLINHIVCHDSKNTFTCKICHKKYASRNNLYAHSQIHNNKEFRCKFCNKNFTTERYLQTHLKIHIEPIKKFQCDICDRKFGSLQNLGAHIETEHLSDKQFPCDQCSESFTSKTKLKGHMNYHGERFTCRICGKHYSSYFNLCGHLQIHKNEKFICDYCNKVFVTKSYLRKHIYTHTKPIQCDLCNKSFAYHTYLAVHLASEHSSEERDKKILTSESNCQTVIEDRVPIADSSINHSFKSKTLRNKRETKGLQGKVLEIDINTTQNKIFHCDSCAIQFTLKSDLNKHLLGHNKSSGYTITKQPRLSLRVNSNKQDIDETESCISGMRSQIDSQTYKRCERKQVRYTCHKCNMKFPSNRDFRKHYLVHSASKFDRRSVNVKTRRQTKVNGLEKPENDSNGDKYSISSDSATTNFPGQQILEQLSFESEHDSNQHSNSISEVNGETSQTNLPQIVNDRQSLLMGSCITAESDFQRTSQFSSESEYQDHDVLRIRDESVVSKSVQDPNEVTCLNKASQSPIRGTDNVINCNIRESVLCSAVVIIEDSLPERFYCNLCTNEFHLESDLMKHLETHTESDMNVASVNGGSEDIYCDNVNGDVNDDISNNEITISGRIIERQTANDIENISSSSLRDISKNDRLSDPSQREFEEEASSADEPNSVDVYSSNSDNSSAITVEGKERMLKSIALNKIKAKVSTESSVRNFDLLSKTLQSGNGEEASSVDIRSSVEEQHINIDNSYAVTEHGKDGEEKSISRDKIKNNTCTESNVVDFDVISKTSQSGNDEEASSADTRSSVEEHNINNSYPVKVNRNHSKVKSNSFDVIEDKLCTNETDNRGSSSNQNEAGGFLQGVRRKRSRINYKDLESGALMNMIDVTSRSSKIRKKHIFAVSGRSVQF